ncbi:MAG: hypothetical protein C4293_06015 [Nitrospiraceae bacterium]
MLLLVGCLVIGGCSILPKGQADLDVGMKERGIASWYGDDFHGWVTASGDIYDMYAMTGAHRTLPLGTVVRVTNVVNGRHVEIRINDRGPYVKGRILDLSYGAAERLNMVEQGISAVHLEVIGHQGMQAVVPEHRVLSHGSSESGSPFLSELGSEIIGAPAVWLTNMGRDRQNPRLIPSDIIRERRARRVSDILAADQRTYAVASLKIP